MGLPFEPPHAQRRDVQNERKESAYEDDPAAGESKGFAVVKRKEPGQHCLAGGKLPPILYVQHRPAMLIQPDDAVAAGATDFFGLAQTDLKCVAHLLRRPGDVAWRWPPPDRQE